MDDSSKGTRYSFAPAPGAGGIFGFEAAQVAAGVVSLVLFVPVINAFPSLGGIALGAVIAVVLFTLASWQTAGHSPIGWIPVTARFVWMRASGAVAWRAAAAGSTVVPLPSSPEFDAQDTEPVFEMPPELAAYRIVETTMRSVRAADGSLARLGVAHDTVTDEYTAVIRLDPGSSFFNLPRPEQEEHLRRFGGLLATFALEFHPVSKLTFSERTLPASNSEMVGWLRQELRVPREHPIAQALWQLTDDAVYGVEDRECLLGITISLRKYAASKAASRLGGGDPKRGIMALLVTQTETIMGQIGGIGEIRPMVPTAAMLARILRDGIDPFTRKEREVAPMGRDAGIHPSTFGPSARHMFWSSILTDGSHHRVGVVRGWPSHSDVRADWTAPLLADSLGLCRIVTVALRVVPRGAAIKRAERKAFGMTVDRDLKAKKGFLERSRHAKAREAADRTENELAEQHQLVEYVGHMMVSVPWHMDPDQAFAQLQAAALGCGMELGVAYALQDAALAACALPVGRGLS